MLSIRSEPEVSENEIRSTTSASPGNERREFRARALRYLILRDYAPSRKAATLAGSSGPAFCVEEVTLFFATGESSFGQGISARGVEGSRTPLFGELPDVSAYFATDHSFQHPGKKRLRYFPINSRCNRQTSPPDAGKLNCASNVRRIPAAQ